MERRGSFSCTDVYQCILYMVMMGCFLKALTNSIDCFLHGLNEKIYSVYNKVTHGIDNPTPSKPGGRTEKL